MPGAAGNLFGRDDELAEVARFIGSVPERPCGLLFEGEAGIGKTALWLEAVGTARDLGIVVLSTRPVESETTFSYSALGDLFEDVFEAAAGDMPAPSGEPSRSRSCGPRPMDLRRISMRFRWRPSACSESLAASAPLILAIDDVHWIDPSSARVLGFAVRRLKDERVGILATARTGLQIPVELSQALDRVGVRRVTVGPMRAEGTRCVCFGNISVRPSPDRSSLGSTRSPAGIRSTPWRSPGLWSGRVPVRTRANDSPCRRTSSSCSDLGSPRFRLPPVEPLLTVAATARPTEDLVLSVAGRKDQALAGLGAAEAASVIRREGGSIRFTHPLLGSTVYAAASAQTKRRLHGRLAELVLDVEERASHLALSTTGPDADVAEALEEAARHARARGAPDAAAGLGSSLGSSHPSKTRKGSDGEAWTLRSITSMPAMRLVPSPCSKRQPPPRLPVPGERSSCSDSPR